MEHLNDDIRKSLEEIKRKSDETTTEWLSDAYRNGTEAEKLLYEFATVKTQYESNLQRLRANELSESEEIDLLQQNQKLFIRMNELNTEYSVQMDIDDGPIFK